MNQKRKINKVSVFRKVKRKNKINHNFLKNVAKKSGILMCYERKTLQMLTYDRRYELEEKNIQTVFFRILREK